jgi:hypothetical protein
MNAQKEKMIKTSKILSVILLVCAIILLVSIVPLVIFAGFAPTFEFSLNNAQIDFLNNTNLPFSDLDGIRAWMIDMVFGLVIMIAILFVTSGILKAISIEGTPFTKKNSDKIKIIALLLIANETVIPALQSLLYVTLLPESGASATITLGNIIIAAVFFCLALIFDYGRQLQEESDELL